MNELTHVIFKHGTQLGFLPFEGTNNKSLSFPILARDDDCMLISDREDRLLNLKGNAFNTQWYYEYCKLQYGIEIDKFCYTVLNVKGFIFFVLEVPELNALLSKIVFLDISIIKNEVLFTNKQLLMQIEDNLKVSFEGGYHTSPQLKNVIENLIKEIY